VDAAHLDNHAAPTPAFLPQLRVYQPQFLFDLLPTHNLPKLPLSLLDHAHQTFMPALPIIQEEAAAGLDAIALPVHVHHGKPHRYC